MSRISEHGRGHVNIHTAAAGTPTADAIAMLASWIASHDNIPTDQNAV